jgi:group II intron reverse transcriptase/maturase
MAAIKPKSLKKQILRNHEYYDIQADFDALYKNSQHGITFSNLLPLIMDSRNIKLAYRSIKGNKGSKTPGTDGKLIDYWATSGSTSYISYVRHRLNNYQPEPVRRVEIPKGDGRTRPLGIPTIGDRLVQQCIKQVLEPICEAKFHKSSFGFRPNRSTHHAIAELYANIHIRKTYHIVDIDIKGFFDNVDHGKLLKQLWTLGIRDKNLLSILSKMLKGGD